MTKNPPVFNVMLWDFNDREIKYYNVMEYLLDCWKNQEQTYKQQLRNLKRRKVRNLDKEANLQMPSTYTDIKDFLLKEARYMFWARCQYEIVVTGFPEQSKTQKIDVYDQIESNIDVIVKLFMDYLSL